jgi:hypothetical protein
MTPPAQPRRRPRPRPRTGPGTGTGTGTGTGEHQQPPAPAPARGQQLTALPRAGLRRFRADIGGDPLQVLVLLASFALAGYAFYRASSGPLPLRMLIWFIAAIIGHDLILYPLYALADHSALVFSRKVRARVRTHQPTVPVVNYIRIPLLLSGLLLLVFFGLITGQGNPSFRYASDHPYNNYLAHWLITVATLFGLSALLYATRLGRARARERAAGAGL